MNRCTSDCALPGERAWRTLLLFLLLWTFTSVSGRGVVRAASEPAPAFKSKDILGDLSAVIDWKRSVDAIDPSAVSAEEALFRDASRRQSLEAMRLAFAAARGEAGLLSGGPRGKHAADSSSLEQAAAQAEQRVTEFEAQMDSISQTMRTASAASQPSLSQRRDLIESELRFAREQLATVQNLTSYIGSVEGNGQSGSLLDKIAELENTTPAASGVSRTTTQPSGATETTGAATPGPATAAAASSAVIEAPQSLGIVGMMTSLFAMTRKMSALRDLEEQTQRHIDRNEAVRTPLRAALLETMRSGQSLSASTQPDDAQRISAARDQFDMLTARFTALSSALVPIREQGTMLAATKVTLDEWRESVLRTYGVTARTLLFRVGVIVALLIALGGLSALWKRATFRYIGDVRRRRQFLVVRRIVVLAVAALIFIGGFVSEFGSLATYAGLLTAGLAVALQTVIVSGFAYFFFVGRYGVRVGDRITIGNVTGDVIDVGLFRLYMMELAGSDRDMRPSGRVVVFSNSVLLQPQPFFKLLPGSDYVWHQIAMTLSPDSDHAMAEREFVAVVDAIYCEYKDEIEQQYRTVTQSSHLQLPAPKPEHWLRFVDAGLEFVVRYPVEISRAPEIDDRITRTLLAKIESTPTLRLVAASTPRIQAASPAAGAS